MSNITRRDLFIAAALANPNICTGVANDYELKIWFGGRGGITKQEIMSKQATMVADEVEKH